MSCTLKAPQLLLDYLLPVGREKFRLPEVAAILSADDGQPPVSLQSIRNGMQEGRIFGNRIPFGSKIGEEERIRVEWMTRSDVLHALLVTRTSPAATQLNQLLEIIDRLPPEAHDEIMRRLVHHRARRPIGR